MNARSREGTPTETTAVMHRAVASAVAVFLGYVMGVIGVAGGWPVVDTAVVAALIAGWGWCYRRRKTAAGGESNKTPIGEALLLAAAAMVASRMAVGFGIELYALVLLVVVWVVSTASARTAAATVAAICAVEAISHGLGTATATAMGPEPIAGWEAVDWVVLGQRLGMIVAFGALAWMLVGRRAVRRRRSYRRDVERERKRLLEEARQFRLIHAGRSESDVDPKQARELIVRDAVDAVHETAFVTLEMIKTALNAHTVILLWFDVRNERLQIKELLSDSDDITEKPIDAAEGVIGGITRRRDIVRLADLREGFRGLSYYRRPQEVTEFVGAPVIEEGHLRGVLCADRGEDRGFDDEEVHVVERAASFVLRAVENERMVASIERTRFEVGRFYEASRRLNGVLTPDQVHRVALDSVRRITDYDFAALTLYDDDTDRHRVLSADGEAATTPGEWTNVEFSSNRGLVSMVVRNRHYLPAGGQLRNSDRSVLTDRQNFSQLQSLLVLPLIAQDQPVGTMVVGHRRADRFPTERREMLEVTANQVAVTLHNARMYAEMESMAKYDALTGLANRRTFETKLEEAMARHKRAGRTFGLILTDIDHFKSVNDTYGHPVGDEVLRTVGDVFSEQMRAIDVPARYGGEEFALILEDTDLEGARLVAERLREAIAEQRWQTEQGELQCTISLGISVGPWDSGDPHELVDLADQALYHSKENGRNQVTVYRDIASSDAVA